MQAGLLRTLQLDWIEADEPQVPKAIDSDGFLLRGQRSTTENKTAVMSNKCGTETNHTVKMHSATLDDIETRKPAGQNPGNADLHRPRT